MLYVCLLAFHIACEDDGTDSAMRKCVPQPNARASTHYHVVRCALQGAAGHDAPLRRDVSFPRRKRDNPAKNRDDSAAFHESLVAGGIPSSNVKACVESWQFAPVVLMANGIPHPSQIKWCFACCHV